MTDFEMSAINSFSKNLPQSNHRGCFFHFSQCIWRKIQKPECQEIHNSYILNSNFALMIKMLPALTFVPSQNVTTAFEELMDDIFFVDNQVVLQALTEHFEDTWIGRPQRRGRIRLPIHSISLWNFYNSVVDGLPKTTTSVHF